MKTRIFKQLNAWLPVFLWALLIFHFSSGTVPVASPVYWQDFTVKKTGHILLFGSLAILIYRALRINNVSRSKSAIYAVFSAFLYGATDEFHQLFTQGREARVRDVFIDGFGATLAIVGIYFIPEKLSKELYNLAKRLCLV